MRTAFALPCLVALAALAACGGKPQQPLVRLPAAPPPALLITHVAVLDPETGTLAADRDVLVVGDRITSVADPGQAPPPGAQTVDGKGATLLPGLIDMHGHVGNSSAPRWKREMPDAERNLLAYLYSGVTTVLDPADMSSQAFARRDQIASGALLGPRVYAAGPMITAHGGHPIPILQNLAPWWLRWYLIPRFTREADTPDEARAAVRELAAMQPDVIKLTVDRIPEQSPRLRREVLQAAVDEARTHGLRTVAHIGTVEDARDSAESGVSAWMHGIYRERVPDEELARLAAHGVPMVATIGVFESYAMLGQGARTPSTLERETVAADVLGAFDAVPPGESQEMFRPYIESLRSMRPAWRENVRRLRAAGVTILAGSDTQMGVFPGAGLHRELQLLTEAGLTPAEAIRAATLDAARYLANGKEPDFGRVAAGQRADLLLVEGDPTADLNALSRIRAVIRNGVMLERRAL